MVIVRRVEAGEGEQLRAIQRELGESDEKSNELEELSKAIQAAEMPEEAEKEDTSPETVAEPVVHVSSDGGATEQMPSADAHAEQLIQEGRLEEAEAVYRGFARMFPEQAVGHLARADALRARRANDARDVVVRVILPVK